VVGVGGQLRAWRTRAGTIIAAARTWVATSVTTVAASSGHTTEGMHEIAVSATAERTNHRRAAPLRRLSTARRTPPMTAPSSVICAKPRIGIISPSISRDTPAAWAPAATAAVATAAATPDTAVVRGNVEVSRPAAGAWVVAVVVGAVRVIVVLRGSGGARCAADTPSTNARPGIDSRSGEILELLPDLGVRG
jgi:hypothetical protein